MRCWPCPALLALAASRCGAEGPAAEAEYRTGEGELSRAAAFEPFESPWPAAQKYEDVDHSHNWCPLKAAILSGQVSFQDALRGQEVSMLFAHTKSPVSVQYNSSTRMIEGGLSVEVFEELARRSGFHWHKSVAVVDYVNRTNGEKDDDWLRWAAAHYDVVDWFAITVNRSQSGLAFAFPFINISPALVGKFEPKQPSLWERLFTLFAPFSPSLWLMIVVGFLLAAPFYMCIEHRGELENRGVAGGLGQAFYNTFGQCTGGGGFAPKTPAGKIYVLSASFLAMILVTSYTANLATQMVFDEVPVSSISSLDEAVARDLPICLRRDSPYAPWLAHAHPGIRIHLVDSEMEKLPAVQRGDCVAAVIGELWWDFASRMSLTNPKCQLETIGRKLLDMRGSFVSQATSRYCKEILMDIMAFRMHEMYLSGYLQMVEGLYIDDYQDVYCSSQVQSLEMQMQIRHMGGAFLVHGLVALLSIAISVYYGHCLVPGGSRSPKGSDAGSSSEGGGKESDFS
mmetsp:Transcript_45729/g.132424  ORF Transcript_45729/g.132424 Transcript_45729/m.132424 type:complete len:512 (-) Transcript_45729:71-1606(-)